MFRIPMIFPGQASQSVGMASSLFEQNGPGSEFLSKINDTLGYDLTSLMFEGPAETLTETKNAQPAILAHSVAIAMELAARDIKPSLVAGHSLGEYSAAVAAGAISAKTGLALVRKRGELMFEAGNKQPGTMAAVMGLDSDSVSDVCKSITENVGTVVLANHNSQSQVAISGEVAAIDAASEALKEAGAKRVIKLNVSGAFHSPLLEDAATEFSVFLDSADINGLEVPLVSNVTANAVSDKATFIDGLKKQLTSSVRWYDTITGISSGVFSDQVPKVVLEVGPGRVLSNMARREFPDVTFIPVGTAEDLNNILDKLNELSA
ncbi:ACP S-malonyltransferase [bacterium]|nr:ACP S-malonyltransferase [bacterium]